VDEYRRFGHVIVDRNQRVIKHMSSLVETLPSPRPAVAICNSVECWPLIGSIADANVRVVSLIHENLGRYPTVPLEVILKSSDEIIFPADAMKQIAARTRPSFDRGRVLPQGLLRPDFGLSDRSMARRDVRRELNIPDDANVVLGCGTRDLRKGFDLFHQLASKVPSAYFLWVGGDDAASDLQKWMKHDRLAFGIANRTVLVPSSEDPERYFLAADAFALTSRDDPFPCVVHEAMAAGLPVVVFAGAGGAPEAVAGCGVAVSYLNLEEMGTELAALLECPETSAQLGAQAEAKVRSRYKFDEYARRVFELAGQPEVAAPVMPKSKVPKVFLSHRDWSISGVNTMSARLVKVLRERGIDASLVFWEIASSQRELLPKLDHKIFGQNRLKAPDKWAGVEKILTEHAPCILITNYDYTTSAVSPRLPDNVGIIGTARSDDDEHLEHAIRLGRYWNRIATVSSRIRDRIIETDPSLSDKTIYIPNFVEGASPRSVGATPKIALFFASRLVEHPKRVSDLVRIVYSLRARQVPFILRIAGEGPAEASLRAALAREVEEGAVAFLGRLSQDEISKELRRHDILLLTSSHEGMPNVVLEGMSNGCVPVVTSIESGIPELIEDGVSGMVVAVGDTERFGEIINRLHLDRGMLASLSSNAVGKIRQNFSVEVVAPRYEELIRDVWAEITTGAYKRPYAPRYGPYPGISVPPALIKELHPF